MRYRPRSGRPVQHTEASQPDAVRYALRERDNGFALAMTFDPGDATSLTLTAHAASLMLGLMKLRGWRHDGQDVRIGLAADWTERWWERTLGPWAFVVESDLAPTAAADLDDINHVVGLTMAAWCMEREMRLAERPAPELMTVRAADAIVLASIHPEPLCDAMRAQRHSIVERMAVLPESTRSATYAHVLIHLDASTVRPWSLPDRACVFGRGLLDCASQRVFVALEDTAEPPRAETAHALLRLMLAGGAGD